MPAATPLKPSVLDRLIADLGRTRGDGKRDTLPCFVPTLERFAEAELRQCLMRDIGWILNDICFGAAVAVDDFPEVATAVLNQGLPDFTSISLDRAGLARRATEIATALKTYESRLVPESVHVTFNEASIQTENKLQFVIHAQIRNAVDEFIELRTDLDLDTGHVEVRA